MFWCEECLSAKGGELSCEFRGEAKSDFLRNRIGFCVLHPIRECAGKAVRFTSPDGREHEGSFPDHIAPHQPFLELKTFTWNPGPGITATLTFEGDVFEMEDQRNWTDASFKTYCTPLSRPLPVPVHPGDRVNQRIKLTVSSERSPKEPPKTEHILDFTDASALGKALPSRGFQFVGAARHSKEVLELLAQLRPNHLRVDLDLARKDWREKWRQASNVADRLDAKLHAALFLSEDPERELTDFRVVAQPAKVSACLVFDKARESTSLRSYTLARRILESLPVVVGTTSNFTELNRQRPPREAAMVYSFNPQVHAFDDLSVMETLEAQAATVESARRFCDGAIHVGPITLRPRSLPNATRPEDGSGGENALPAEVDSRQCQLIAAAWTVGTLANLLGREQVASLTFFETVGSNGLLPGAESLPNAFGAQTGEVYPIYYVFLALAGAGELLKAGRDDEFGWLCFRDRHGQTCIMVANLRPEISRLQLRAPSGTALAELKMMDSHIGNLPRTQPIVSKPFGRLALPPYAVAFARFS